jgi:hypothetical protein
MGTHIVFRDVLAGNLLIEEPKKRTGKRGGQSPLFRDLNRGEEVKEKEIKVRED